MDNKSIHKIIVGTFETDLGKKCLAHFEDVFVNRAIFKVGETLEQAAYRQGQADLVKQIMKETR